VKANEAGSQVVGLRNLSNKEIVWELKHNKTLANRLREAVAHCNKCGNRLECTRGESLDYDICTGLPFITLTLQCPNKKHWWDRHRVITINDSPSAEGMTILENNT